MKIGLGYDAHALVSKTKLILGGLEIAYEKGLKGHSDGDVLVHAIIDAILGALNLGSIGEHFPDTDQKYKNIYSLLLLEKVQKLIISHNCQIGNIDAVIIAQEPKLSLYIPKMKELIAKALQIHSNQVSIKATTTEKLGFEGQKKGIAAQAIVLLNAN
jgi:2-C-methyl-D-erythritol 2,4-cyclodiphosphate synthase